MQKSRSKNKGIEWLNVTEARQNVSSIREKEQCKSENQPTLQEREGMGHTYVSKTCMPRKLLRPFV
jgi:hypothetical protein